MVYYRIYESIEGRTSLGYGLSGGRWNHKGTPLIYAACSVALAMMELLCIKGPTISKSKWILASLEVPDKLPALDETNLPDGWNSRPSIGSTKNFGTSWALGQSSVALRIPSARIPLSSYPAEHNLLINPLHPDFESKISIVTEEQIYFGVDS